MIDEMMPTLDKEQATSIARKLSSLPSILKCVDGSNIQAHQEISASNRTSSIENSKQGTSRDNKDSQRA
jgi:hypothetical protein